MKNLKEKSLLQTPNSYMKPTEFKEEALSIIEMAVYQRKALKKEGKSHIKLKPEHVQIERQFLAYRYTWKISGLAKFIYKYHDFIKELIPWTNRPLLIRLDNIYEASKFHFTCLD